MKLLLIDKDGTLTEPASGNQFVQSPTDQVLLPGVADMLKQYVAASWTAVIVSNQGGVEAGHKALDDAIAEMRYCMKLLPEIEQCYFCPDFRGTTCVEVSKHTGTGEWVSVSWKAKYPYLDFRKPNNGMLIKAMESYGVTLSRDNVLMVGDRLEDEQAAEAADIPFLSAEDWRSGKSFVKESTE